VGVAELATETEGKLLGRSVDLFVCPGSVHQFFCRFGESFFESRCSGVGRAQRRVILRLTFPCEPDALKTIDSLANGLSFIVGHCFDSIGIEIGFDFGSESKNMIADFVIVLLDRSCGGFVGGSTEELRLESPVQRSAFLAVLSDLAVLAGAARVFGEGSGMGLGLGLLDSSLIEL
jgi:hypothetical protein